VWAILQGVLAVCIGVGVVGGAVFAVRWRLQQKDSSKTPDYRRRCTLLSAKEKAFYLTLLRVMGEHAHVFVKVRLADLVFIPNGTDHLDYHRGRVGRRYVDFVLCSPSSLAPVLAINVLDNDKRSQDARYADELICDALRIAGLPLLQIRPKEATDPAMLSRRIRLSIASNSQEWKDRQAQTGTSSSPDNEAGSRGLERLYGQLQRWFPDIKRVSGAG